MAWSAPMTAVGNSFFTASQYNQYVRDNLSETAPYKATTAGSYWVSDAQNLIVERVPVANTATGPHSTSSGSWVSLTNGPAVTVNIPGRRAWVAISAEMYNSSDLRGATAAVEVSGATTIAPDFDRCIENGGRNSSGGNACRYGTEYIQTGLNSGSTTFTMKYTNESPGTSFFSNRHIVVLPL